MAFVIDMVILTVVSVALWIAFRLGGLGKIGDLIIGAINFAYFTFTIGSSSGQTPGMKATSIAVSDTKTGRSPSYPKAFARYLLMSVFSAMVYIGLLVDCLWALYDEKRQALHDKAVGTVVIETSYAPVGVPSPGSAPADPVAQPVDIRSTPPSLAAKVWTGVVRFLTSRPRQFWVAVGGSVVAAALTIVGVKVVVSMVDAAHSPNRSAIAYLQASSRNDISELLANSGIVTPTVTSAGTAVLLTPGDIKRELSAPQNSIGQVSNIVVKQSHVSGNTATVTLDYISDNESHTTTYTLIKSSHTSSGWAVQVAPARLDIDVPAGVTSIDLAGIKVAVGGQVAHAYVFPSVFTVSMASTPIFQEVDRTVDTTHQAPGSDPQEVSLAPQLYPSLSDLARLAVTQQIQACIASSGLAPANCPNSDAPYGCGNGDSCTGVVWSATGDPTTGVTVTVDPAGAVTASGTLTATDSYIDTSNGDGFFGPISSPERDGPHTWNYVYPLTWNGSGWVIGKVAIQNANGQGT